MVYSFVFDPAALSEFHDALLWYGGNSISAMERFELEVYATISGICHSPTKHRQTFSHYREANVKKFPYSIVFVVQEEMRLVVITSVYHHKRNPKRKYKKQ